MFVDHGCVFMKNSWLLFSTLFASSLCFTEAIGANIPTNEIRYVSSDGNVIKPTFPLFAFGANVVSNTYDNGYGIIKFDGDIKQIEGYAHGYMNCRCGFAGCVTLTTIELPDGIASLGEEAFSDCDGLEYIEIPKGVKKISESVFLDVAISQKLKCLMV